ncbi:MAG: hypothetical protein S4CHLAM123_11020 [Chlamydiales bacterium]|nr:hypothetical protein [Chlamydiales bacterium]
MSLTPFILLVVGLLLIFLEFFLPGGIMGIFGGLVLIVSVVFFGMESESVLWTLLYALGLIIIVGFLMRYALWRIRNGKAKGIFLNTVQEGYVASAWDKELIGKRGEALSDLKPAGHILVEGKRYQAVAKMGYIIKGTAIEVIHGEGAHLVVKKIEDKKS